VFGVFGVFGVFEVLLIPQGLGKMRALKILRRSARGASLSRRKRRSNCDAKGWVGDKVTLLVRNDSVSPDQEVRGQDEDGQCKKRNGYPKVVHSGCYRQDAGQA